MNEKKLIIGFVGKISSGKGMATEYLMTKYGAHTYRFSTMLRDLLNRLYLEINRENLQSMSKCMRNTFGNDIMAKVMFNDVKADSGNLIVIDGIRRPDDIIYLRELPEFKIVRVEVDPEVRYQRLVNRTENADDRKKTYEQFLIDEQGEPELEIPKVMEEANFSINNNGTEEELHRQINELIEKLKK